MKTYLFNYSSAGNFQEGPIVIEAENIGQAQDKFVGYLKESGLWEHMWQLSFKAEEVEFYNRGG